MEKTMKIEAPYTSGWWMVTINVRQGELTCDRKHLVRADTEAYAYRVALETEASYVGNMLDDLDPKDNGHYSADWGSHFTHVSTVEVACEDGATLRKYL